MLQEKEKKTWSGGAMGMDHSALIPLRSKNFRERSDAHFVDVIKEDRLERHKDIKQICLNIMLIVTSQLNIIYTDFTLCL